MKPGWLAALETHKFFDGCSAHENERKKEKNICCIDCCSSLCPHCVAAHRSHRLMQVRRYVYHDVVRLEDIERLIDCSSVQCYTLNGSKVVFIRKRPQSRQVKGSGNACTSCDRTLQEPYTHCSICCKVEHVLSHEKDLSAHLRRCESLHLGPDFFIPQETCYYGGEEDAIETMASSDSESSEITCRKRGVDNGELTAIMNRRKGVPHRSPLS